MATYGPLWQAQMDRYNNLDDAGRTKIADQYHAQYPANTEENNLLEQRSVYLKRLIDLHLGEGDVGLEISMSHAADEYEEAIKAQDIMRDLR